MSSGITPFVSRLVQLRAPFVVVDEDYIGGQVIVQHFVQDFDVGLHHRPSHRRVLQMRAELQRAHVQLVH